MRKLQWCCGLLMAVGIALCLTARAAAPPQDHQVPSWEYKVVEQPHYLDDYVKVLGDQGKQGWEYCETRTMPKLEEDKTIRQTTAILFKRLAR